MKKRTLREYLYTSENIPTIRTTKPTSMGLRVAANLRLQLMAMQKSSLVADELTSAADALAGDTPFEEDQS